MDDGGPWHDGGLGGRGREEDDEEEAGGDDEEDDDEFISQNAAQEDGAAWHPNTVKMLKVLRRRVGDSGSGRVGFQRLSQGSRRNRAANQFFEILQLKTWDFIQVDQVRACRLMALMKLSSWWPPWLSLTPPSMLLLLLVVSVRRRGLTETSRSPRPPGSGRSSRRREGDDDEEEQWTGRGRRGGGGLKEQWSMVSAGGRLSGPNRRALKQR